MTTPATIPESVHTIDGAICYRAGMRIDADGSPHAYNPNGGALDYLANAGTPGNWYGLVCDASGAPVVQGPLDLAPGFYVSPTALADKSKATTNPRRYVDSETVAYIAIPPELKTLGVKLGDLCVVGYKNMCWPALVADIGPRKKYGEGSIKLAKQLSIPSSPRNGGVDAGVTYVIFPGTGKGWPNPSFEVDAMAKLDTWGGASRLPTLAI